MPKPKNKVRSREEILLDMQNNKEFMEKMNFVKNEVFPALVKASKNVNDARQFLTGLNSTIMNQFLSFMKEKKVSDIDILSRLVPEGEKVEEYKHFLSLFQDKSIFEAKDILEGLSNEIALFVQEEMNNRTLDTLKTRWIDEIKI